MVGAGFFRVTDAAPSGSDAIFIWPATAPFRLPGAEVFRAACAAHFVYRRDTFVGESSQWENRPQWYTHPGHVTEPATARCFLE